MPKVLVGSQTVRRRRYQISVITGICAVTAVSALLGNAQSKKAAERANIAAKCDSPLLPHLTAPSGGRAPIIVQFVSGVNAARTHRIVAAVGGIVTRDLDVVHAVAATVPDSEIAALAADPQVRRLSADSLVHKTDEFTVGHSGADIANAAPASGGWGLTGQGVGVAVIDSGIVPSADLNTSSNLVSNLLAPILGSRLVASVSFLTGQGIGSIVAATLSKDPLGHGTHVAGIIAGNGAASSDSNCFRTFYGVARGANLVSVQVLNNQGEGNVSDVIAGIGWVIQNKAKYNIRVINLSLGHPVTQSYTQDPLDQAVEAAWRSGIVVVCSAGNSGRIQDTTDPSLNNEGYGTNYGTILCPGNDPDVITVGAMKNPDGSRPDDRIATYSSRGPTLADMVLKPDLVAPGNRIISLCSPGSTLDTEYGGTNDILWSSYRHVIPLAGNSFQYYVLSGTSMAAPVVSGAAALILQKYPTLSPDTVKARLMFSADKWSFPDGTTNPFTFGAGYLDIPAALANKATVPSSLLALSPTVTAAADGNVYVDPNRAIWGNNSIWGTGVSDDRAIWGNNAIQGSNTISDDRAIWGNVSNVQDTRCIWGNDTPTADLSAKAIYGEQ